MTKLPKSSETSDTGRRGVTIAQDCIEAAGWLFRRQDGDTDFGVDAEIEVVSQYRVTGRIVKCQVKSKREVDFDNTREARVSVATTTYNLWRATPLPTILLLVDKTSRAVYWTPALAHHPKAGAETLSIRFEKTSNLQNGLGTLQAYLGSWFDARGNETINREVPIFHKFYEELKSEVDHYDPFLEMFPEEEGRFRLFYQHVLRLRLDVGLRNEALPSLNDWYIRNEGIADSSDTLSWIVFSEAMKLIGHAYEEALTRLTERIGNIDLSFENQALWNFISARSNPRHVPHAMGHRRSNDLAFHAAMEAKLDAINARNLSFKDKRVG